MRFSFQFKADVENALYDVYYDEEGFKQIEVLEFPKETNSINAIFKVEYYFNNQQSRPTVDFAQNVLDVVYSNADQLTKEWITH